MSFLFSVWIIATVILFANYLLPFSFRQRQLYHATKYGNGFLCLTFDDGPDPILTHSLMELLEKKGAKATFFFVGFRAERHPDVCRKLSMTKNEIGSHSYWHRPQWKSLPWDALADVQKGYTTMAKWISPLAPFRPPRGKMQLSVLAWLLFHRIKPFWWTHDSGDTHSQLPNQQKIIGEIRQNRGGVVLLHSFHKDMTRQKYVLELTSRLIDLAREESLTLCTSSEYLDAIYKRKI